MKKAGWSTRGLTQEGVEQAQKLAVYLKRTYPSIVRLESSDLPRAKQTADIIGKSLGLQTSCKSEWRETNNGVLAGMPNAEAESKFPGLYFKSLNMDESYPGGESPQQLYNRISATFEGCKEALRVDSDIKIVVTHSGVINIIYHLVKNLPWTNQNPFFPIETTSLHLLAPGSKGTYFELENGMQHLIEPNADLTAEPDPSV